MSDINLLVFDEAHHAKKNHPYNVIMREFYFDPQLRVRWLHHASLLQYWPLSQECKIYSSTKEQIGFSYHYQ